jgi:hypothetical protein
MIARQSRAKQHTRVHRGHRYSTVKYNSVQISSVQLSSVQFSSVQFSSVQCCAVVSSVERGCGDASEEVAESDKHTLLSVYALYSHFGSESSHEHQGAT